MTHNNTKDRPPALALLASERPRNVGSFSAGALLFGDWGTSRLYVLGLAFFVAGRSAFWLILAMSLLILAVGWAYTQICRLYPDGGGVYTAGKRAHPWLGMLGALLLFSDYTVTASLSAIEAFHYFGLGQQHEAQVIHQDAGSKIVIPETGLGPQVHIVSLDKPVDVTIPDEIADRARYDKKQLTFRGAMSDDDLDVMLSAGDDPEYVAAVQNLYDSAHKETLFSWRSPGLWAIISILAIGCFNLLGPKHSSAFAIFAACGMIFITLVVVGFAIPQMNWATVSTAFAPPQGSTLEVWEAFVFVVLALSGVEAIANLTGVMKKPVAHTAKRSIWMVAGEVAAFNLILTLIMLSIFPLSRDGHKEDMMAYLAGVYIGPWGEWPVRIIAGTLLLSAANTAVNGLMSITYVMSRDGELPAVLQKLNGFGAPWVGALVAAAVPALVLLVAHDLQTLAAMYALGVVGAVAIAVNLCAWHPRLRRWWRKIPMMLLGVLLAAILVTLIFTKIPAGVFVSSIVVVGFSLRALTRWARNRKPRMTLLRQAIVEQLPPSAMERPRILLATAGSAANVERAMQMARDENAALVVTFVRDVALNYKVTAENRLTLDTDPAAVQLFIDVLELGYAHNVPVIPAYDTSANVPETIAELAAINAAEKVLIGTSRRGTLHQLIKGSFQHKLESLLPTGMPVKVLS